LLSQPHVLMLGLLRDGGRMTTDKRKQSLYFPEMMLKDIQRSRSSRSLAVMGRSALRALGAD
jgi:uncharacterized small protein (TIGR04563 family)